MTAPFEGLRVLELSGNQVGAGIGQFFADYGADVVMVEPPGGSALRASVVEVLHSERNRSRATIRCH